MSRFLDWIIHKILNLSVTLIYAALVGLFFKFVLNINFLDSFFFTGFICIVLAYFEFSKGSRIITTAPPASSSGVAQDNLSNIAINVEAVKAEGNGFKKFSYNINKKRPIKSLLLNRTVTEYMIYGIMFFTIEYLRYL